MAHVDWIMLVELNFRDPATREREFNRMVNTVLWERVYKLTVKKYLIADSWREHRCRKCLLSVRMFLLFDNNYFQHPITKLPVGSDDFLTDYKVALFYESVRLIISRLGCKSDETAMKQLKTWHSLITELERVSYPVGRARFMIAVEDRHLSSVLIELDEATDEEGGDDLGHRVGLTIHQRLLPKHDKYFRDNRRSVNPFAETISVDSCLLRSSNSSIVDLIREQEPPEELNDWDYMDENCSLNSLFEVLHGGAHNSTPNFKYISKQGRFVKLDNPGDGLCLIWSFMSLLPAYRISCELQSQPDSWKDIRTNVVKPFLTNFIKYYSIGILDIHNWITKDRLPMPDDEVKQAIMSIRSFLDTDIPPVGLPSTLLPYLCSYADFQTEVVTEGPMWKHWCSNRKNKSAILYANGHFYAKIFMGTNRKDKDESVFLTNLSKVISLTGKKNSLAIGKNEEQYAKNVVRMSEMKKESKTWVKQYTQNKTIEQTHAKMKVEAVKTKQEAERPRTMILLKNKSAFEFFVKNNFKFGQKGAEWATHQENLELLVNKWDYGHPFCRSLVDYESVKGLTYLLGRLPDFSHKIYDHGAKYAKNFFWIPPKIRHVYIANRPLITLYDKIYDNDNLKIFESKGGRIEREILSATNPIKTGYHLFSDVIYYEGVWDSIIHSEGFILFISYDTSKATSGQYYDGEGVWKFEEGVITATPTDKNPTTYIHKPAPLGIFEEKEFQRVKSSPIKLTKKNSVEIGENATYVVYHFMSILQNKNNNDVSSMTVSSSQSKSSSKPPSRKSSKRKLDENKKTDKSSKITSSENSSKSNHSDTKSEQNLDQYQPFHNEDSIATQKDVVEMEDPKISISAESPIDETLETISEEEEQPPAKNSASGKTKADKRDKSFSEPSDSVCHEDKEPLEKTVLRVNHETEAIYDATTANTSWKVKTSMDAINVRIPAKLKEEALRIVCFKEDWKDVAVQWNAFRRSCAEKFKITDEKVLLSAYQAALASAAEAHYEIRKVYNGPTYQQAIIDKAPVRTHWLIRLLLNILFTCITLTAIYAGVYFTHNFLFYMGTGDFHILNLPFWIYNQIATALPWLYLHFFKDYRFYTDLIILCIIAYLSYLIRMHIWQTIDDNFYILLNGKHMYKHCLPSRRACVKANERVDPIDPESNVLVTTGWPVVKSYFAQKAQTLWGGRHPTFVETRHYTKQRNKAWREFGNGSMTYLFKAAKAYCSCMKTYQNIFYSTRNHIIHFGSCLKNIEAAICVRQFASDLYPRVSILNDFRKFVENKVEAKIQHIFRYIDTHEYPFEQFILDSVASKRKLYRAGMEKFLTKNKISLFLEAFSKTNEVHHSDSEADPRPRCIFNPSSELKAVGAYIARYIIKAIKHQDDTNDAFHRGFVSGMNLEQTGEFITNRLNQEGVPLSSDNFYSYDGSGHDSHQHRELIQIVDNYILNRILPSICLKLGFETYHIDTIISALTQMDLTCADKNGNLMKMSGSVYSGHPTRTTLFNTLRTLFYNEYIAYKAGVDIVVFAAGDDVFGWVSDMQLFRDQFKLIISSERSGIHGLGQLAKDFKVGTIGNHDFLSKNLVTDYSKVELYRKADKVANSAICTEVKFIDQVGLQAYFTAQYLQLLSLPSSMKPFMDRWITGSLQLTAKQLAVFSRDYSFLIYFQPVVQTLQTWADIMLSPQTDYEISRLEKDDGISIIPHPF